MTTDGLRGDVVRGGVFLVLREALGMLIRAAGLVLVTRLIGTTDYGLYAGPSMVVGFLAQLVTMGGDLFLIRREVEEERWYAAAYGYLLVVTVLTAGVCIALALALGPHVVDHRFVAPFCVLAASIPLNVLWVPAKSRLERSFAFGRLAVVELVGDVALYGVGVPLALLGFGVWAPTMGYVAWQASLLVLTVVLARKPPRVTFSWSMTKEILGFGAAASSANLFDQVGNLVVPVVVGPVLGPAGLGIVALTVRVAETLSFARKATWRLAVVAIGRIRREPDKLRVAVEEGMALQLAAVGPLFAAFALVARSLVPYVLGHQWIEVAHLFPTLAVAYLLMAAFTIHNSMLIALGGARQVLYVNVVNVTILVTLSALLVPHIGAQGYALAEVAAIAGYAVADVALRRHFSFSYLPALPWLAAAGPALLAPYLRWPWELVTLLPAAVVFAVPAWREQTLGTALRVLTTLRRRRRPAVALAAPEC